MSSQHPGVWARASSYSVGSCHCGLLPALDQARRHVNLLNTASRVTESCTHAHCKTGRALLSRASCQSLLDPGVFAPGVDSQMPILQARAVWGSQRSAPSLQDQQDTHG